MLTEASQEPIISVVIATKNKSEYLFATLLSFCSQTLPPEKYEIIVVCNGETPEEMQLKSYIWELEWPFTLRDFSIEDASVSMARNKGISSSNGEYLVFVDDDCPVAKNFLEAHLKSHDEQDNSYVVGYTRGMNANTLLSDLRTDMINSRTSQTFIKNDIAEDMDTINQRSDSFLMSRMANTYYEEFKDKPGASDFPFWILFIPRNVSINRRNIKKFDAGFKGWGMEDWELGYRLCKSGVKATINPLCINYHLNHRISPSQSYSLLKNLVFFIRKHPEYPAFLSVRFNPRSIKNPTIIKQSLFGISLASFAKNCQIYKNQPPLARLLMWIFGLFTAYLHILGELFKVITGTTITD